MGLHIDMKTNYSYDERQGFGEGLQLNLWTNAYL